jgi:hypothetical protein
MTSFSCHFFMARPTFILVTRPCHGVLSKLTYIESHTCIELANDTFGFNGWSSSIKALTQDFFTESASCIIIIKTRSDVRSQHTHTSLHKDKTGNAGHTAKKRQGKRQDTYQDDKTHAKTRKQSREETRKGPK